MANSPNMGLSVLIPGTTTGPGWATSLESDKLLIDSHTHVAGQGVQVPSAGLNINANLPFGGNAPTGVGYVGLQAGSLQSGVLLNAILQSGSNLYWNNGSGQPVQITSAGSLAASTIGGITGLSGTTAALTYSAALQLFIATSNTNLSAGWDGADITVRPRNVVSAQGVKIQAPTTLASSYTTTLPPALPLSTVGTGSGILLVGPAPSGVQSLVSAIPAANLFGANQFASFRVAAFNVAPQFAVSAFIPDTVYLDAGGGYSTANGIYTIPASGIWWFSWGLGGNAGLSSRLVVNSGIYALGSSAGSAVAGFAGGSAIYCNALVGDKVKIDITNQTATTTALSVGSGNNYFQAFQIR
jgi:hypothetical protein